MTVWSLELLRFVTSRIIFALMNPLQDGDSKMDTVLSSNEGVPDDACFDCAHSCVLVSYIGEVWRALHSGAQHSGKGVNRISV